MATLSSSSSQSYYLRFSSHTAALSRSLLNLLSESYCTDVHISTGHQSQTIRAHKLILSAFSPYFKSLFASLPANQFPVIIIREITYDILRTIIEFCYRGEILVSRDKLDDIVSAAKFLQIEGAKDFIIPKSQTPHTLNPHMTGQTSAKMQIDLQAKLSQTKHIIIPPSAQQQLSNQRTVSLLSKMVQKPPINITKTIVSTAGNSSTIVVDSEPNQIPIKISGVRHINEREFVEIDDDEDEEDDDEDEDNDDEDVSGAKDSRVVNNNQQLLLQKKKSVTVSDDKVGKTGETSGMFAEFEDHVSSTNAGENNVNNSANSNRNSDKSNASSVNDHNISRNNNSNNSCDEPMDTTNMGKILAKVPAGTSVSTTIINESTATATTQMRDNKVVNAPQSVSMPAHGMSDYEDEEEEDEDEDLDEDEENANSTNPLDICNVNMSETEESQPIVPHMDASSLQMSSATARAIAASTFASFNQMDLEVEPTASSQSSPQNFNTPSSVTISSIGSMSIGGERRGRGRPPKYVIKKVGDGVIRGSMRGRGRPRKGDGGSVFSPHPTPSTPSAPVTPAVTIMPSSSSSSASSMAASTRSRRGRPPSMPEELLRSLTGRLDKAHHKCPHCPQIYYGYHAMRDHITSVHLNSGEKYICNLCNKEYTWRITLRKHLKFHHGVHPDQVPQA